MNWYSTVSKDMNRLTDAISYYEIEYNQAVKECEMKGTLEKLSQALPGLLEHRFSQLQDMEAILNFLNIERNKTYASVYERFLLSYQKALKSTEIEKFVRGDKDVVTIDLLINEFANIRNKFLSIMKGLDAKQWQITNITKLRVAGLDDAYLD